MQPQTQTQTRLRKFIRQPELLPPREITPRSLDIIALIHRYRFLPTSLIIRLMAPGAPRNTHRHLQHLFHRGLLSRFAFPHIGRLGEFIYYLENPAALRLIADQQQLSLSESDFDVVVGNREKDYGHMHKHPDRQGQLIFLHHELMVSRFHAMIELACRKFAGKVELAHWVQGSRLWNRVEVSTISEDPQTHLWIEHDRTEFIPHRPDAWFSLRFPEAPAEENTAHFFYEADRGTEYARQFIRKLRGHFHFIVKQNRHELAYNTKRIRAVLIETTSNDRADQLREHAKHPAVSGLKPSPLFWFTSSEFFTKPITEQSNGRSREVPRYLLEPEWVLKRIWAPPVADTPLSLLD